MKKSRFTDSQIMAALKRVEAVGIPSSHWKGTASGSVLIADGAQCLTDFAPGT